MSTVIIMNVSSCRTFFGYYYYLEDARNEKKNYYEDSDYFFTVDLDNAVVDFVIKDDTLIIVEIEKKNGNSISKYQIKTASLYSIEEQIYTFKQIRSYDWTYSTKLALVEYNWCIVSSDFNYENDNISSFEFLYKNELYCLCYQFLDKYYLNRIIQLL